MVQMEMIDVIGAGLAGCEAAWQLARRGHKVRLHEMRKGGTRTAAHQGDGFAELVCSNSLRSDDPLSAIGLLHEEMRGLGSLIMEAADEARVPAGSALAVDRDIFSAYIERALAGHDAVEISTQEVVHIPRDGHVIVATGPLTSDALSRDIIAHTGEEYLAFFDALAPIVERDSINMDVAWFQSRYDKGDGSDYINCPMNEAQYGAFYDALMTADKTGFKDWEKDTPYFEGCLPIEVMASRGEQTLLYGPMKPVGLRDPNAGERPYAVVQLRQDNKEGTLYNIVGFQTKLTYGAQKEVFGMIPGLEGARFARLGAIHRNTFLQSPKLLEEDLRLRTHPHIRFAGQITGVEGYVESASMGLLAGMFTAAEIDGTRAPVPPRQTAIGALLAHITTQHISAEGGKPADFQPMNVNFGLMPPLEGRVRKKERKQAYLTRARGAFDEYSIL